MIPQHSSLTDMHFTPKEYVEAARAVLGGITLDPASCRDANELTVKAGNYFTQADDGLSRPWNYYGGPARVFLNPPGGLLRKVSDRWAPVPKNENGRYKGPGSSSMAVWWGKLVEEFTAGRVEAFVFIGFTLEILRLSQDTELCPRPVQDFSLCFPRERMRFGGDAPTHANVIAYGGPSPDRFVEVFSQFGRCTLT